MVVFALLIFPMGCVPSGSGPSYTPPPKVADSPPPAPRTIQEVDAEIDRLEKHIDDLGEYEKQQRKIGVINQVEHDKSRGWTKGDGKPSYEDLADQAYAQAAATEKEIQRLKRQLSKTQKEKQDILSQSTGCFLPGALVKMEDGSFKPFLQIEPGDEVLTYDIGYDTLASRPVVEVYAVDANHLYTINGEFMTTGGERLLTRKGWKKVRDLKTGDAVHVDGRMVEIDSIAYHRVDQTLHNMQVEGTHNFYVVTTSGAKYLVHNTSGGGGGGSSGGGK
jgi:polyhydroxyalkanoate synthesis regulator phasin